MLPTAAEKRVEFMDACFKGQLERVQEVVKSCPLLQKEFSFIDGYQTSKVEVGRGVYAKSYDVSRWNPVLLAIVKGHHNVLQFLYENEPVFHKISILSKPYDSKIQKLKAFDHSKRLKRECFALKLSIYNQDETLFKFLWSS